MKRLAAATGTAMLLVFGVSLIPSISATSNKVISSCVNTKSGAIRIASKCLKGETALSWNSQSMPGPSGAPGPTGAPGPSGVPGQAGAPGTGLVVLDANNQLVGYPLGVADNFEGGSDIGLNGRGVGGLSVFIPSTQKIIYLSLSGLPWSADFYYTTPNCTGQRYLNINGLNPIVLPSQTTRFDNLGGNPAWWAIGDKVSLPITTQSTSSNDACSANTFTWSNTFDPDDPAANQDSLYKYNSIPSPIPPITGPIRLAVR